MHGQPRVVVVTGLAATRENLGAVKKLRDAHRLRVQLGEPEPIQHLPFAKAVEHYLAYKEAKHRDKPATARRIATSLTSWREFMGQRAISTWTRSDVLDYLTWRRATGRLEVTSAEGLSRRASMCAVRDRPSVAGGRPVRWH